MTPAPGRYLLVQLAPDLAAERTTFSGVLAGIRILAGVVATTDLAYVSQDTLDLILLTEPLGPDEPVAEPDDFQMELIA